MCNCGLSVNMVVRVNFHYQLNLESPKRHDARCSEVDLTQRRHTGNMGGTLHGAQGKHRELQYSPLRTLGLPRCEQPHSPTPTTATAAIITPCAMSRRHLSVLTLLVPKY